MTLRKLVILFTAISLLAGCTSLKKLTGQKDDTVLPGTREEVLPKDAQTARDPVITGEQAKEIECDPKDPDCIAPIDQESAEPQ
jgi:hypothetical protein